MTKNEKSLNFIDTFLSEHKKSNYLLNQFLRILRETRSTRRLIMTMKKIMLIKSIQTINTQIYTIPQRRLKIIPEMIKKSSIGISKHYIMNLLQGKNITTLSYFHALIAIILIK